MSQQLYIPKTIKVGFQKREGTVNNRLAYITYVDEKGKHRKQTSLDGWRDKAIPVEDFKNEPQDGFCFNKNIQRYNWSHFGSGRSLIRVFDPRGIEFEITTENLIMVLMNTDCLKRGLVGSFVYAWHGPELVLLPVGCEEYQKALNHTNLQACKISAKDVIPGCSYKTKRGVDLIYLGRFDWYAWGLNDEKGRVNKKFHIFFDEAGVYKKQGYSSIHKDGYILLSGFEQLAQRNTQTAVSNYADLIEKFQKNIHSQKIVKFEVSQVNVILKTKKESHYGPQLLRSSYFIMVGNQILEKHLHCENKYKADAAGKFEGYEFQGYTTSDSKFLNPGNQTFQYASHNYTYKLYKESEIQSMGLGDLYVTLENGKRIRFESFNFDSLS